MRYICKGCGYVYDPVVGDPETKIYAGTEFENIPDDWCCPLCYLVKEDFEPLD